MTMALCADFCAFKHLIDGEKAYGCMRHDVGRVTNKEIGVLAPPLVFTASFNKRVEGVVSFSVRFATVRINGATGGPTPPQLHAAHKLLRVSEMDRVVQWVKDHLPSKHPLAIKGWTVLPAQVWELPDDVAVQGDVE